MSAAVAEQERAELAARIARVIPGRAPPDAGMPIEELRRFAANLEAGERMIARLGGIQARWAADAEDFAERQRRGIPDEE